LTAIKHNILENEGIMKKLIIRLIITVNLLIMGACAYETGTQFSDAQMIQVVDNKTTVDELVKMVGYPPRKTQMENKEIWYYHFTQINSLTSNINEITAFEVNRKGIVISHYKTNGNAGNSYNPLLRAAGQ
jgi:outer membrane protein assembly factor BamE